MTPRIDLLESVMAHIKAHPDQHDQGCWIWHNDCGTVACFAGWAVLLHGQGWQRMRTRDQWVFYYRHMSPENRRALDLVVAPPLDYYDYYWSPELQVLRHIRDVAAHILGLDPSTANIMFSSSNSRAALELMVKDLANDGKLRTSSLSAAPRIYGSITHEAQDRRAT